MARPEDFGATPASKTPRPEDFGAVPARSLGSDLGRQVGLTLRAGVEGLTALPNMAGDALGLRSTEAVRQGLTSLGLPLPANATERVAQDVAGALSGFGGLAKAAQLASPTSPAGQAIARTLKEALATQAAATTAASGAAGVTREMGGGPGSQLIAGLGAGVALPMGAQVATQAVPNLVARSLLKSEQTPFAREGQRLRETTGIDLTAGQETGNKALLGLENASRQYGPLADRVQDVDVKIANQAIKRVEEIAEGISSRKLNPDKLGTAVEDTVKGAARQLDEMRDAKAAVDYGRVRKLAGDKPVIQLDNFANELRKIIDEHKNVAGADAQKITTQAIAALKRITGVVDEGQAPGVIQSAEGAPLIPGQTPKTGTVTNTVTEAMKSRRFYGKASKGEGNVFDDIAPSLNRTLASRLFSAVNRDFDQSAANAGGELRKALDAANGNYRKHSQSLEYLEKSVLGRLVGEDLVDAALSGKSLSTTAGETVLSRLSSAAPSSRKAAIEILDTWNPELSKDVRANVLREALDKAMSIPPSQKGASQVPLSFNRFISAVQGEKTSFARQLQSWGFDAKEIADITDTVKAMARAGDRTGYNFSGTNVQKENLEIADAVGAGLMGNIGTAASKGLTIAGKFIGLSQVVRAMETPAGREALRTLHSPKASPQAIVGAFATVESVPASEPQAYWQSKGGRALIGAIANAPATPPNALTAKAAQWVAAQAGGGEVINAERLAAALDRAAPQLRRSVVEELIRQGRIPSPRAQ